MQQQHNNFGHAHISTASQYDDFIMMKETLLVKLILRGFIVKYKSRYIIQFENPTVKVHIFWEGYKIRMKPTDNTIPICNFNKKLEFYD